MTRCIAPVLLATGILGCNPTPSDAPDVVDGDILDDFAVAAATDGDAEGFDIDFPDDRGLTTGTTGPDDADGTLDDFTLATDTGPGEAEPLDDLAAPSNGHSR